MRHFFANVAGESFHNDDGTDRQPLISRCRVGEALILDAEPDNPQDENAIRVLRLDGKQIGYIERAQEHPTATPAQPAPLHALPSLRTTGA